MEYNRNFFIAIALSMLVMLGWQFFFAPPLVETPRPVVETTQNERAGENLLPGAALNADGAASPLNSDMVANALPGSAGAMTWEARRAVIDSGNRIRIETANLQGSINLQGALIDDLQLKHYRETVDRNSPLIALFNPALFRQGYFAEFGFVTTSDAVGLMPSSNSLWQVEAGQMRGDSYVLSEGSPVTLIHDNGAGLLFRRTIAVDGDFMFTFHDAVTNEGSSSLKLASFGRVARVSRPDLESGNYLLHEGMIGVIGAQGLQSKTYQNLDEAKPEDRIQHFEPATGGWIGITDKYWAAAIIPPKEEEYQARFVYSDRQGTLYQSDFIGSAVVIAPGATQQFSNRVFAGAKQVDILEKYENQPGAEIQQFGLLIDWGRLGLITKPMFVLIDWLYKMVGNFGFAILLVTVILKAVLFPLANKSYKSMARMKKLQPAMMEIREKYADDKVKQQQEVMQLYRNEKVNPLAGCWPLLIQFPIFFALYKVLYITIEMRHAPFLGWILDLAAPDPTSLFNLFGLLPYDVPEFLMIGVWPIIMGVTMFLQMRMNPTPPDPTQAMIFTWMPLVFTFMLATFPAGLVIYWAWNNTLSIIQQGIIMKKHGVKIELFDNLKQLMVKKPHKKEEK